MTAIFDFIQRETLERKANKTPEEQAKFTQLQSKMVNTATIKQSMSKAGPTIDYLAEKTNQIANTEIPEFKTGLGYTGGSPVKQALAGSISQTTQMFDRMSIGFWQSTAGLFNSIKKAKDNPNLATVGVATLNTLFSPAITTFNTLFSATKPTQKLAETFASAVEYPSNKFYDWREQSIKEQYLADNEKFLKMFGQTDKYFERLKINNKNMEADLAKLNDYRELSNFISYFAVPGIVKKGKEYVVDPITKKKTFTPKTEIEKVFGEAVANEFVNKSRIEAGLEPVLFDVSNPRLLQAMTKMSQSLKAGEKIVYEIQKGQEGVTMRFEPRVDFIKWGKDFINKYIPDKARGADMKEFLVLSEKVKEGSPKEKVMQVYDMALDVMGMKTGKFSFGESRLVGLNGDPLKKFGPQRPGIETSAPLPIPEGMKPLYEEAKKYKSAEEFVEASPSVKVSLEKTIPTVVKDRAIYGEKSLTPNEPIVGLLVDNPKRLAAMKSLYPDKNVKMGDTIIMDGNHRYFEALKRGDKDIEVVYKSQLTDIWNQANLQGTLKTDRSIGIGGEKQLTPQELVTRGKTKIQQSIDAMVERKATKKSGFVRKKETTLLKHQVKTLARGIREGEKFARDRYIQTAKEMIDQIKEILPPEEAGKFSKAIADATVTANKRALLFERAKRRSDELNEKKINTEFDHIQKLFRKNALKISVDYQSKLREVFETYTNKAPSERTVSKLQGLAGFIERNGELGVPAKYVRELRRLGQKDFKGMTTKDKTDLIETIKGIYDLGRLKFDRFQTHYNEKVYKERLNKLVSSTTNGDSGRIVGREKIEGLRDFIMMESLQPSRVMDSIDGRKGYQGENAIFQKKLAGADQKAEVQAEVEGKSFFTDLQAEGIDRIPGEVEQIMLAVNIYNRQGALDQVQTLMKEHGLTQVPTLTPELEKIYTKLVEYAGKDKEIFKPLWEEMEGVEFIEIDNYFPIKYEGEFATTPTDSLNRSIHRIRSVKTGAGITRQKGVKQLPRTDVFNILLESIRERKFYLNMKPVIHEYSPLYYSKEFANAAGKVNTKYIKDYIDGVLGGGYLSANSIRTSLDPILKQGRINISKVMLGYKLGTILKQPLAIFDALSYTTTHHPQLVGTLLTNFSKTLFDGGYTNAITEQSYGLQARKGGEQVLREIAEQTSAIDPRDMTAWQKYQTKAFAALQNLDLRTASGVQKTFVDEFKKTMSPEEAREEADFVMRLVSGSSLVADRPLNAMKGEGMRMLLTFKTFIMNRFGIVAHDIIKRGIIDGDAKTKMLAVVGLGVIVMANIVEDYIDDLLKRLIKGKDGDFNLASSALVSPFEMVPFAGDLISAAKGYGGSSNAVSGELANMARGISQVMTGKETSTKLKGVLNILEGIGFIYGAPGSAQATDILEGMINRSGDKGSSGSISLPKIKVPDIEIPKINIPKL